MFHSTWSLHRVCTCLWVRRNTIVCVWEVKHAYHAQIILPLIRHTDITNLNFQVKILAQYHISPNDRSRLPKKNNISIFIHVCVWAERCVTDTSLRHKSCLNSIAWRPAATCLHLCYDCHIQNSRIHILTLKKPASWTLACTVSDLKNFLWKKEHHPLHIL